MPYRLDTHVLTVDANVIRKVDTGNPANLYSMWTVFSRHADSVEQGPRLENLSGQRETLVVDNKEKTAPTTQTLLQNIPSESRITDLPPLSGSVESLRDEEAVDFTSVSAPLGITRPRVLRQDSCTSIRSKRGHYISSDGFEKMIIPIVNDKEPLSAPPRVAPRAKVLELEPTTLEPSSSTTTESQSSTKSLIASDGSPLPSSQSLPRPTVVRGFYPSQTPMTPGAAQSSDTIPELKSPSAGNVVPSKQPARPAPGHSCSSSEQDQSFSNSKPMIPIIKKPVFQIGGSSEEDGPLKSAMVSSRPSSLLSARTIDGEIAEDSDTGDYIDESAIDDDDDSSDWEDSAKEGDKSSMDDKSFQRVNSKPNLTSQRSLITLVLAKIDRARKFDNHVSQSTSAVPRSHLANGPSLGASPNDSDEASLMTKATPDIGLEPIHEESKSNAQPTITSSPSIKNQDVQSPLLAITWMKIISLLANKWIGIFRRNLLRERQQDSSAADAVLKQPCTPHDADNLNQSLGESVTNNDVHAYDWDQRFLQKIRNNGYHYRGW
ncbi:hypothetical protein Forpe1208_v016180 [Fusarium oxysporum f. sp. rapae]|uniref:Nitrogen regulatory protein areA GATA-like domain-containing protein n=1 Tax=Fusarium oxysporum f. sp. rapae TaxID=485398 RepID=A0A8J5NHR0_FUSOX|nr:hypothetical protein Forpe1208_v016180 [Fusarium oxysporum f. sp. rapae]